MLRNGVHFSTLIPAEPWLFDYYKHMGYASVFQYSVKEITLPEFIPSKEITVDVVSEFQDTTYSYLNKKLSERPCCIQHSLEDFQVIMADLPISGGSIFVAKRANEIKGIAIIYREKAASSSMNFWLRIRMQSIVCCMPSSNIPDVTA